MAGSYYHKESTQYLRKLRQLQPDLFASFVEFHKKVFAEGTLTVKMKELIAVAPGHALQCPFCIEAHTARAQKAGATEAEIAEAVFVAMALRAGASFAHAGIAMEATEPKT
jgi:AhpD family alkylhydroperoxidase